MRAVALVMVLLAGGVAAPVFLSGDRMAEGPTPVPDLQVLGVYFEVHGRMVGLVQARSASNYALTVYILVNNIGPGRSTAANLSIFQDGTFLAMIAVGAELNATGDGNRTWVAYIWNISGLAPGWHLLKATASDPVGDANLSDNSAEYSLHFLEALPELNITLTPQTQVANITANRSATVEFLGMVRTESIDGFFPSVDIEAKTSFGWHPMVIKGPGFDGDSLEKQFKVRVEVPRGSASDWNVMVIVNVDVSLGGLLLTGQATASVTVGTYHCVTVECERPHQTIGPGDRETFEYFITNNGNDFDSYALEIDNRQELEARGWSLNLSRTKLTQMTPHNRAVVRVVATPPADWSVYKDEVATIKLNVTSLNGPASPVIYSDDLPATVRVRGYNTPGVMLLSSSLIILAAALVLAILLRWRRKR